MNFTLPEGMHPVDAFLCRLLFQPSISELLIGYLVFFVLLALFVIIFLLKDYYKDCF